MMTRRQLLNRGALTLCAAALPSIRLRQGYGGQVRLLAQAVSPAMTTPPGARASSAWRVPDRGK